MKNAPSAHPARPTCSRKNLLTAVALSLGLGLAACGGGGGGGGGGSPAATPTAPAISSQPWYPPVKTGTTASLQVAASGTSLSYQWQKSTDNGATWNNVNDGSGGTSVTYTTPVTTSDMRTWQYRVVVSNSLGTATSVAVTPTLLATALKLPHSGITNSQCYKAGDNTLQDCTTTGAGTAQALNSQQDGMRGVNLLSYSLLPKAGGGNYLATECVKDNVTGLIWQGKPASTYDANYQYTGFFTNYDSSSNGGSNDNITADTNSGSVIKAANTAALCGYTDWRLPTLDELRTLVDYSRSSGVTIYGGNAGTWFPNTDQTGVALQGGYTSFTCHYWTSTPWKYDSSKAWAVNFDDGAVSWKDRSWSHDYPGSTTSNTYAMCVRLVRAAK